MKKTVLLLLVSFTAAAQPGVPVRPVEGRYRVSASLHYGFVIAHRSSITVLQKGHVRAVEFGFFRQTRNAATWPRRYHYPELGVQYRYIDLGNATEMGAVHAATASVAFAFPGGDATAFDLTVGAGLAYLTRTFDRETNRKNIAIGSRLNGAFSLDIAVRRRIAHQAWLSGGLQFNHFSNGAVRMPNLGFNVPTVRLGFSQYLGTPEKLRLDPLPAVVRGFRHSLCLSGAVKEVYPVDGPLYYVLSLAGTSLYRFSHKSAAGLGLDIHYDNSLLYKLSTETDPHPARSAGIRTGINVSYELLFDRCSVLIQLGKYLRSELKDEGMMYQRLGIRYAVWRTWFVCSGLKAHAGKADYVDLGFGKRF